MLVENKQESSFAERDTISICEAATRMLSGLKERDDDDEEEK